MPKPKHHIFVCNNKRPAGHPRGCCQDTGSMDVWQKMSEELDDRGIYDTVRITGTTCVGPCGRGPVVIVQPDNVWYGKVTTEDVKEIFESHIVGGTPVERLVIPEEEI